VDGATDRDFCVPDTRLIAASEKVDPSVPTPQLAHRFCHSRSLRSLRGWVFEPLVQRTRPPKFAQKVSPPKAGERHYARGA
jgi:hypothetical protein